MRIAIVIDSLIRGGAERQALYSARELSRRGCDVEVVYYHDAPSGYDKAMAGGAKFTFLPKNGTYLRFFFRLRQYLKQGRFDIVHAYKNSAGVYACTAAALAGVPVIFGSYRWHYQLSGRVARLGHRLMNGLITGWIANSKAIAKSLVKGIGADPKRIFVVYNGIDPAAFRSGLTASQARRNLGLPEEAGVVSIIGRLRPEKNHAMFLRMAARVSSERADTRFLVIGDGPMEEQLLRQAVSLGIEDVVYFLGIRTDIGDLLAATDVSVLTSPLEGLANSLVEAMSAGVPVISTDYPGVDEVFDDGKEGFVVPLDDEGRMAARVLALLKDAPLRERMGALGAQKVSERFGMEAMANSLLGVYQQCFDQLRTAR